MSSLGTSNVNSFNPIKFAYLNPENTSNLNTVEDIYNYYNTSGKNKGLYSNINLPSNFNYKIYLKINNNRIYSDLGNSLYSNFILTDPERLSIIHQTRYNTSNNLEYSIRKDFKVEVFKTFNDISLDRLMPTEYYLDYIDKSNNTRLGTQYATLGTTGDFITNLLNTAFSSGFSLNSDFEIHGTTTTSNLLVKNYAKISTADIDNINTTNLIVDTLTVNNKSFTETLFQDGVKLEQNLTVLGSNSIFSNNVQISNLNVLNNTVLNILTINNNAYFNNIANFNGGIKLNTGNTSLSNNTNIEYLIVDKTLQVTNSAFFNTDVYVASNLNINNSLQVKNNVGFSNNLNVALNVTAAEFITISDKRIKNNIEDLNIKKAKNILTNMNVKEYNIQNNVKKSFGLIAQELELIAPQLINTTDNYRLQINKYITRDIDNVYEFSSDIKLLENEIIVYSFSENSTTNKYIGIVKDISDNKFILERINYNERIDSVDEKLNFIKHDKIFIHERIINNFKSINYTEIIMLCVKCIQDIYKNQDLIEKNLLCKE